MSKPVTTTIAFESEQQRIDFRKKLIDNGDNMQQLFIQFVKDYTYSKKKNKAA